LIIVSLRSYPVSASIRVLDLRSQVSFTRFQVSLWCALCGGSSSSSSSTGLSLNR
jgi:hypothetical protein